MSVPPPPNGVLLLCLDLQPVLLRAIPRGADVLKRCQFAIAAARGLGIPVVFTEQVPAKLGATDPSLLAGVEVPEVHPKVTFSALAAGSPVRTAITAGRKLAHLFLCGAETSICVYQTAADALNIGCEVTVLTDCVAARREDDAQVCLDALGRAGARILPSETLYYVLLQGAAHPFFRKFTDLVKYYA